MHKTKQRTKEQKKINTDIYKINLNTLSHVSKKNSRVSNTIFQTAPSQKVLLAAELETWLSQESMSTLEEGDYIEVQ